MTLGWIAVADSVDDRLDERVGAADAPFGGSSFGDAAAARLAAEEDAAAARLAAEEEAAAARLAAEEEEIDETLDKVAEGIFTLLVK